MTHRGRRKLEDYEIDGLSEIIKGGKRPEMSHVLNAVLHADWPGGWETTRTYIALYNRTNEKKGCKVFPSMQTIADDARISVSTVYRDLEKLIEGGFVVRLAGEKGSDGQWPLNSYFLPRGPVERLALVIMARRKAGRPSVPSVTAGKTPSVTAANDRRSPVTDEVVSPKDSEVVLRDKETSYYAQPDGWAPVPPDRQDAGTDKEAKLRANFEAWWKVYPEKVAKKKAWTYYKSKTFTAEDREMLIARTEDWIARRERLGRAREFVPPVCYPLTFLNGRRWEDVFKTDPNYSVPSNRRPAGAPHDDPVAAAFAAALLVEKKKREERDTKADEQDEQHEGETGCLRTGEFDRAREASDTATLDAAAECCVAALAGPTAGVRARGATQPLGPIAGAAWRRDFGPLGGRNA